MLFQVKELVKVNFLVINIYYESLQVKDFQEFALYDDYAFAADIGRLI